jgi:hypothetical protein
MGIKIVDDSQQDVLDVLPDGSIVTTANQAQLDAFSNMRTAPPSFVADGQLTYDLQPIIYEQLISANGAIVHDATNRCATITLTDADDEEETAMQSFQHYRYQAGRGQEIFLTFAAHSLTANTEAFVRYGDGDNAIEFATNGTLAGSKFTIRSNTASGDRTVLSADWIMDKLDVTGPSRRTLDPTKTQIVILDIQALYVGRVRCGFDIDGQIVWTHEFYNANVIAVPYIQTANLPVSAGIRATAAAASGSMRFICSCVLSRGGQDRIAGYDFAATGTVTAGSGTRTHLLSVRPKATFNSITNRVEFVLENVEVIVTGANPVYWELCLGQALTTPTYADVNATYSAFEVVAAGTLSGNPGIVCAAGHAPASVQSKGASDRPLTNRYPITLTTAGLHRDLGTLTLLVTGIGGTSACRGVLSWRELR